MRRFLLMPMIATAMFAIGAAPALAQVRTIDPDQAIDGDLAPSSQPTATPRAADQAPPPAADDQGYADSAQDSGYPTPSAPASQQPYQNQSTPQGNAYSAPPPAAQSGEAQRNAATESADTYNRDDLMSAAEGVFGKGAEGLAGIIEKILKDQGRPNAYIAGREASGAFVVGLRYGSGILTSKIEGQQPVYWTGPSVGFDVGGDANKVFVLVYNLYDTEELYKRFPAGEGHVYFVGGFSASYLRSGNTVLIPVRLGVGWRAGVNVGYMKFSHHEKWMPF